MYTIVVADDEMEIRQALISRTDWESVGFTVVGEAENGVEALELVERLEPDLLLTDIRMPFLSGLELARQVREVRPATQIAFLSGHDDFSYAQQAIQYNIISYMLKPISAEELMVEFQKIKEKMDEKYRTFATGERGGGDGDAQFMPFVMPLILDEFQDEADEERDKELLQQAVECGMIKSVNNDLHYSVMITSIRDENGKNITTESNMRSIDSIVKKYLNSVTFYWNGRIVTLLMATKGSLDKYLHIAAEEICQSVNRIMGKKCRIGMGRVEDGLSNVRKAYLSAMKAVNYAKEKGVEMCFISDVECHKNNVTLIVEQALEIIEKNYMNPDLSLVSIGAEIGVSPNYLSASIKKIAGNTFIDLLSKKRIDVAKEHLLHSNMKIREVAERCGYSDQHYFSYCFKKYTGISPNTCRRQNAEGK